MKSPVKQRINEFLSFNRKSKSKVFSELSFCILTANFQAEKSIYIQQKIQEGFLTLDEKSLAMELKKLGHRFPNTRAKYIVEARKNIDKLMDLLSTLNSYELREWIVKNVKGMGYKEASHFLRNIGFLDLAIIDFHIINYLVKNKLIQKPKTLTKKKYLEIESVLRKIAIKKNITLGELDLILWAKETGKVLK